MRVHAPQATGEEEGEEEEEERMRRRGYFR